MRDQKYQKKDGAHDSRHPVLARDRKTELIEVVAEKISVGDRLTPSSFDLPVPIRKKAIAPTPKESEDQPWESRYMDKQKLNFTSRRKKPTENID